MCWEKEDLNYWENPDCPIEYLEGALIGLILYVEGVRLPMDHFSELTREELIKRVAFYEHAADK